MFWIIAYGLIIQYSHQIIFACDGILIQQETYQYKYTFVLVKVGRSSLLIWDICMFHKLTKLARAGARVDD
jgi:hypothetical protein